ncbi:hypothetical protein BC833DRAFT_295342 [Globomyces pollinis-pini]|nr:hypothetical protein BC833DRAFT_295342 [Globomyces pollinis-pini]
MFQTCLKSLAIRGRLIIIGAVSNYANEVKKGDAMNAFNWDVVKTNALLGKSTTLTGFFLNHYVSEFGQTMAELTALTKNGTLKPTVHPESFNGLSSVSDAIKCMHSGKNIGKLVVSLTRNNHPARL